MPAHHLQTAPGTTVPPCRLSYRSAERYTADTPECACQGQALLVLGAHCRVRPFLRYFLTLGGVSVCRFWLSVPRAEIANETCAAERPALATCGVELTDTRDAALGAVGGAAADTAVQSGFARSLGQADRDLAAPLTRHAAVAPACNSPL